MDPSCPWAWITSRWIKEVAPQRDLVVTWRSYCLEIRDDYGVAPDHAGGAPGDRDRGPCPLAPDAAHLRGRPGRAPAKTPSTRCSPRGAAGSSFASGRGRRRCSRQCLAACGLDPDLVGAADDEKWDAPIVEAMDGRLRVRRPEDADADDRRARRSAARLQGPGDGARADRRGRAPALGRDRRCSSQEPGFFEITRPRANPPRVSH